MQIAIIGLARSGKSTVFNSLTKGDAATGGFGGLTVNTGVVKVPDERLARLTEVFKPKREVPADVTYVDLPAPATTAEGEPRGDIPADQLARLRNADALLHVVRAFEEPSVPHPLLSIDAARDLEQLELEFTLADLVVVEKRLEKLNSSGRHGTAAEREANEREQLVLEKILPALTDGRRHLGTGEVRRWAGQAEHGEPGGHGPGGNQHSRTPALPERFNLSRHPGYGVGGESDARSRKARRAHLHHHRPAERGGTPHQP